MKPPWPATAGLIVESISSWTFALSSSLMLALLARRDWAVSALGRASDRNCTRPPGQGQLAPGGLRSAEPRLGEARRPPPVAREREWRPRREPGRGVGQIAHRRERQR